MFLLLQITSENQGRRGRIESFVLTRPYQTPDFSGSKPLGLPHQWQPGGLNKARGKRLG